jgi:guanine nucleotide-binding protein alpha-1 subunit
VLLWKGLCQNKLLGKVDLVLFLNKCDILQRKLESGVRLSRYVKSYDDRPNDIDTASKCASFTSYNFKSHR